MGGDDISSHIIGRMLHRCKGVNILSKRQYNDTAWMLTRTSAHACAARCQTHHLCRPFMDVSLFKIIFHISKSCLIRYRTHCTGTECLTCPKNHFGISMGFTLVFPGKVQINIRLLVSFKSKERLKRNVKSVFLHWFATLWTNFIRHITSGASGKCFYFL